MAIGRWEFCAFEERMLENRWGSYVSFQDFKAEVQAYEHSLLNLSYFLETAERKLRSAEARIAELESQLTAAVSNQKPE